jgi:hypothetical protein
VVPEQPFDPKGVQGGSSQNLGSFFVALLVDAYEDLSFGN